MIRDGCRSVCALGEDCDGAAVFCSGDVVKFGNQRRFADIAEVGSGGLGQSEPVVPIAESILDSLYLGDEVVGCGRRDGEFGGVASALAENAVLVQNGISERGAGSMQGVEHGAGNGQGVATGMGMEVFGGTFEALANFADGSFIELLAKLFLLLRRGVRSDWLTS